MKKSVCTGSRVACAGSAGTPDPSPASAHNRETQRGRGGGGGAALIRREPPVSRCFNNCKKGQIKVVKGFHSCCYDCISCPEGTFANATHCTTCPSGQWSEPGSIACLPPTYVSLTWQHYFVIALLAIKAALLLLVLTVALLFLVHRQTPLVQASGACMSSLTLAALAAMCFSVFLFVARPSDTICQLQQPFFAGALSACLASFLVKSLRILACTDLPWLRGSRLHWLITSGGGLLFVGLSLVQLVLCSLFVRASPLFSTKLSTLDIKSLSISLSCSIDRYIEFVFMFGYNALLVLLSFMCSFLSVKPVHQYNLARDITFSMLIFLFAWIIFIPSYASATGQNKALIQAAIILFSCLGILATAFFPKCYILVFKPELNTKENFQTYISSGPGQKDLDSEGPNAK